jgi:hypothetical protein
MKKHSSSRRNPHVSDGLRAEYRFDYRRSRPNRFASRFEKGSVVVVLEPDVASVFKDSASVNDLLRSVANAVRPVRSRKTAPRALARPKRSR